MLSVIEKYFLRLVDGPRKSGVWGLDLGTCAAFRVHIRRYFARLPNFTGSKTKNSLELKPIIRGLRVITGIFLLQYSSFAYIFTKNLPYLHLYVIRANFCSPQKIEQGSSSSVQFHPRQPSTVRSRVRYV